MKPYSFNILISNKLQQLCLVIADQESQIRWNICYSCVFLISWSDSPEYEKSQINSENGTMSKVDSCVGTSHAIAPRSQSGACTYLRQLSHFLSLPSRQSHGSLLTSRTSCTRLACLSTAVLLRVTTR